MKIIFGLGNPGNEYENTRHNIGFNVLEKLRNELGFDQFKEDKKLLGATTGGRYEDEKVILVKPLTFMNRSGECVRAVLDYYKVGIKDMLVVFDDVDLPLGNFRIKSQGSGGTHNGVKSIIQYIKDQNFGRFKVGIESRGDIAPKNQPIDSFVLDKFKKEEVSTINNTLDKVVEAILFSLKSGLTEAMNSFNKKTLDF